MSELSSGAPETAGSPTAGRELSARASKKAAQRAVKGTARKGAKSFKADGTPKKRWTAAERTENGHGKRRSGGQPRSERANFDRTGTDRPRVERDDRSSFRRDDRGSFSRDDRPRDDRPRTDRPPLRQAQDGARAGRDDRQRGNQSRSFDRSDRPAYSRDDRGRSARPNFERPKFDRPKYDSDDRGRTDRPNYSSSDRTGSDRPKYDRPKYDRDDRGRTDRPNYSSSDRTRSDRPNSDRPAYDRPKFDRDDRGRNDRPRFDRSDRNGSDQSRSFSRDDRPRNDRPRYDRDDRSRSFDRDRPREDRPRYDRDSAPRTDRPRYDRTGSEFSSQTRSERPRREQDFSRPARDSHSSHEDSGSDQMSWEAAEIAPVNLDSVGSENGFAELGVPKPLVAALVAQGITSPFPIQQATIPDALAGRDVLGRGQTGSGKTLGFSLPLLAKLGGPSKGTKAPRAVILVPTRELALQVADVIAPLAKTMSMSVTLIAGGMSYTPQIRAFDRGVDVVVATPGRLIDLLEQGVVDLSQVEVAVLDEADHMADLGFMPAVTTLLDAVPAGGQRLLFSATLDGAVNRLVRKYLIDPVTHQVDSDKASVSTMEHHVVHVLPHDKNALTAEIAGRDGRTVVFVRTQRGADRVAEQLRDHGVMAGALHGGLTQGARTRVLGAFKDGQVPVLVATDVAARGIHVDEVGLVLQVDPPAGPKEYLHRAGRTARAGGTGVVVSLALPHQRRDFSRLTSQAGVKPNPIEARPGDELLATKTGARQSGRAAVSTAEYEKLIAPPTRGGGGRPRGRKDFGRGGGRGQGSRGQGRARY